MAELPTTRASLLVRIRSLRDQEAWIQFVNLFAPLVYGFGRQHGLHETDASDLTQDVLRSVAAGTGEFHYNPGRGTFRAWLYAVARSKLRDLLSTRFPQSQGSADSAVPARLDEEPAHETAMWNEGYEKQLFQWAAERVRKEFSASTWQAFAAVVIEGKKAAEVAAALGATVAAVYLAKSQVLARIRKEIEEAVEAGGVN